ncbi:MAG: sigma-70 family RNA polymerase sigma factor [Clostridia bacterium]|nr:sigma-70 family RNA polymerase sigma factor [Clostridia bacterium]
MTQFHFAVTLLHARLHGKQAMQALAEDHLPLVGAMVRRFPHHGHEPEELYQQGCIGLMKALARFDPDQGTAFSTYAAAMILGEMRMLCRLDAPIHIPRPEREKRSRIRKAEATLTAHLGREPTIQELAELLRMDAADLVLLMEEVSVTSSDALTEQGTPLTDLLPDDDDWLSRLEIRDLLDHLPDSDRKLIHLRCEQGLSQAETARQLGMTQVQVSRREAVLRRQLQRAWLEE